MWLSCLQVFIIDILPFQSTGNNVDAVEINVFDNVNNPRHAQACFYTCVIHGNEAWFSVIMR
jgi:hypothetical protein